MLLDIISETCPTLKTFCEIKICRIRFLQDVVLDTSAMLGLLLKVIQKFCHWLFAFAIETWQVKRYFSDLTSTLTQEAKS